MRKFLIVAAVVLAGLVGGATSAAGTGASSARAPYCGITWGSLAKDDQASTTAPIADVRAGRHDCFDRLVIDLADPVVAYGSQGAGYSVQYVPQVTQDGSGDLVPLAGGAFLEVIVHAPAYDVTTGAETFAPVDPAHVADVSGFSTFRQVADAGSFEGQTTIGLGVRARLPFRAFVLAGPGAGSRVVVDVAHSW